MRTQLLATVALVLMLGAALVIAYPGWGWAQEPPPPAAAEVDLGETDLLVLACVYATRQAVKEGLEVRWCRRDGAEEVTGYEAKVHVMVMIPGLGRFKVQVALMKSLWWVQDWTVAPAGTEK